jgi:hypothetical protein
VYGGCDKTTRCAPRPKNEQTKGIHKYAFIDHGSSFYSRKEPEENPFTGNMTDIKICRFRRSTYESLTHYLPKSDGDMPLPRAIKANLPKNLFRIVSVTVFEKIQPRAEKIVAVANACVAKYSESDVFSLPEYWEV